MWQLLNSLFGWQYAVIIAPTLGYRYVRRVRLDAMGRKYICFTGGWIWFLLDSGQTDSGYRWEPLTWQEHRIKEAAK